MADGSVTINTELDNSELNKDINELKGNFSKLGSLAKTALKGATVAVGALTTAFAGLVTASVNARGELEQQIGGIQTLFSNELGDASEEVIKNANNAYRTAGMSATEYMSTATSFAASLLQSLGKDTQKAAEVTDMAITDMSDNANKMGTSMESIQWAYQGFAKQNYTMLDNLKLGYGGTKSEMERLLADAQKLTGVKYDISNLSDVYNAIHVIQGELGITGTTAKEAAETLQGSMASMKASWQNFLSGSGDLGQVVDTATDVVKNIVRIVNEAIPQIVESISTSLPELLKLGQDTLGQFVQGITTYLPNLMSTAGQIITQLITGIGQTLPELIPQAVECIITIVTGLLDNIDQLIDAGIQLIMGLVNGLIEAIPKLIEAIPTIIQKLISGIIENAPKIIEAGVQLVLSLVTGLIKAIPQIVMAIPQIIGAILQGLWELPGKIWEILVNIIASFINWGLEIQTKTNEAVSNLVNNVINWFKELPRKYMELVGRNSKQYNQVGIRYTKKG